MVVGGEIAKGLEVVLSGLMEIVCILDGGCLYILFCQNSPNYIIKICLPIEL